MLFDLNCDLGEGAGNDRLIMPYITSANIACGGHAGTPETMRETAGLAIKYGVKIGAHPGYPDPDNFGRVSMKMTRIDLMASVAEQILTLKKVAGELGGKLVHVKPHGALYNDAAKDSGIAGILADAILQIDPTLIFVGLSGSVMIDIARERGLKTAREVFADRNYTDEGQLVARSQPEALITDLTQSLEHVRRMITKGELRTLSGKILPIRADTVCIHGDQPLAAQLARILNLTGFQNLSGLKPLGTNSFLLSLGEVISPAINRQVHALAGMLMKAVIPGLTEVIPAYSDLTIVYNPDLVHWPELLSTLKDQVFHFGEEKKLKQTDNKDVIEIPIIYGGENGPDLADVARQIGISEEEVIRRHSEGEYTVYMMGFTPGFCYLGGMDPALNTPRKTEPRLKVPAGSVGIAGNQTGIYPIESPGGWQIIGRTTTRLFEPASEQPFMCKAGDRIRFRRTEDDGRLLTDDGREDKRVLPSVIGHQSSVISILEPGFLTTVQDSGRPGYRAFGMPVSGAMDLQSMRFANNLVGNDPDEAVLEITFTGPVLEFHTDTSIALAGAEMRPLVNGSEKSNGERIGIQAGDRLSFAGLRSGLRTYLAIEGGLDVPTIMGSKSTYLRGRIGGVEGRALIGGDELYKGHRGTGTQGHKGTGAQGNMKGSGPQALMPPSPYARLRFIPGPEADRFTIKGLRTFLGSEFTVSPNSDRMGMRLDGPSVEHTNGPDILSSGVIPGTIQVPGDGKPIILLNDCQTTGGYTRIGCVIREDLSILAQLKPGDKIRFSQTTLNR